MAAPEPSHLGLLRLGGGRAILILDAAVRQHLGHRDGAADEVRVIVQALADGDARRRLAVAQQQAEDVVLSIVTRLGDEAQVRRVGAAVGVARRLLIRVRPALRARGSLTKEPWDGLASRGSTAFLPPDGAARLDEGAQTGGTSTKLRVWRLQNRVTCPGHATD